ncbi:hypothetical protein AB0B28_17050 [Glycomyces sp. NPDC046736]|uniref:hypothetical protein n=1 Tax=Glycomyces sp. NPDC046736 TaxID=3155615 RepID=UPI0033D074A0
MLIRLRLERARKSNIAATRALSEGRLDNAANAFATALKRTAKHIGKSPELDAVASAAHLGLGRVELARGAPLAADRHFAEVQSTWPTDWRGYYWSGCAAARGLSYERADWYLSTAIAKGAPDGRAHLQRAYTRARLGLTERALADLAEAARRHRLPTTALELGATLALRAGRTDQAAWFAAAVDSPLTSAVTGAIAYAAGEHEAALEALTAARDGGFTDPEVLSMLGAAAYHLGRLDEAIEAWSTTDPALAATARYARALKRLEAGDLTASIEDFEAAAEHGHTAPLDALRLRAGLADIEAGRLYEAVHHFRAADSAPAAICLGLLTYASGDTEGAIRHWDRAPDHPVARLGLAVAAPDREDSGHQLRSLAEDAPAPVRAAAARAIGIHYAGQGEWETVLDRYDPIDEADPVWGEALYRTGRRSTLLELDANPWRVPAAVADDPSAPAETDDPRARAETALLLRAAAYDDVATEDPDWDRIAATLHTGVSRTGPADLFDVLAAAFSGHRLAALDAFDTARPTGTDAASPRDAHLRAVLILHALDGADPDTARRCVGAWAQVLADDAYWRAWRRTAEERYGQNVTEAQIKSMHDRLRRLVERAAEQAGLHAAAAHLDRETGALALLRGYGGLPLEDGSTVACGPLRMAELGLSERFGKLVLECEAEDFELAGLLIGAFSGVGLAVVELGNGQPAQALKTALDLRCDHCRATGADAGFAAKVCADDCEHFDRVHPALAGREDGRDVLAVAASSVVCDAALELATAAVAKADGGIEEAAGHWRRAVEHAEDCGRVDDVEAAMSEAAIGRAETLLRRKRYGDAITLLDHVLDLMPDRARTGAAGPRRDRVVTLLVQILDQRGVTAVNEKRFAEGCADLERAVRLAPHQLPPRRNLGVALGNQADVLLAKAENGTGVPDLRGITALIELSIGHLDTGLEHRPGNPELTRLREQAVGLHTAAYNLAGIRAADLKRFDEAARHLKQAVRLDPARLGPRLNLGAVLQAQAIAKLTPPSYGPISHSSLRAAERLVLQAIDQYKAARVHHRSDPELRESLDGAKAAHAQISQALRGW